MSWAVSYTHLDVYKRQEHESEITIHKAAKNYFDGLGFKKLPTIKALNAEYAELLAEKKAAYADYRKADVYKRQGWDCARNPFLSCRTI